MNQKARQIVAVVWIVMLILAAILTTTLFISFTQALR